MQRLSGLPQPIWQRLPHLTSQRIEDECKDKKKKTSLVAAV